MKYLFLQDELGQAMAPKLKTIYALIMGFFISLFLPPVAPLFNNLFIALIFIACLRLTTVREKISLLKKRPAIILMIIFFLLQIISALISEDQSRGFTLLGLRVPLLMFPISIGLIVVPQIFKERVFFLYSVVITVTAIVCLIYSYNRSAVRNDTGFLYNDSLTELIDVQSVYFAFMTNIAIFSYVYLLIKKTFVLKFKWVIYACICFLLVIHFLLASRMEISFLYTSGILFSLYYFIAVQKKPLKGIAAAGSLVLAAVLFVTIFPKTVNRFNELKYSEFEFNRDAIESHYNGQLTPDQWNGFNIRLAIWKCGWQLSKEHPVFGTSIGDKDKALINTFEENGFNFGIKTNKNMHSNYLDVLSSMGFIGLLVFVAGFLVLPILSCIRYRDILGFMILADFGVSLITETYIDRSLGCILLGFMISFVLSYRDPSDKRAEQLT
jgi:O-antigen ligase